MKKRILSILLLATMVATMFVGCGDTNNKETTSNNNSEVIKETEDDESNLALDTSETPETITTHKVTLTFPEGMDGYTTKYVPVDDETWSYNETHYVATNGSVMNFKWNGPTELGEKAYTGTDDLTLIMKNNTDEYALRAWFGGELTLEELEDCLEYSKEFWTSLSGPDTSFPEDGYYNVERKDNIVYVTHSVTTNNATGYARYLCNGEEGSYYMFVYLEENSIYDSERALKVINSLGYWDIEE